VRYLDYEAEPMPADNLLWPLVHKRRSFAHEQEVRALIWGEESTNRQLTPDAVSGIAVPAELKTLLGSVHVAPGSPDWFLEVIASILRRYRSDAPVTRSELSKDPVF
jgi:hypothetical protein